MPVVSPMEVLYFETTRVNSVTKQGKTKARHLRNCVVLAQVSIAQAWVKAGAPEANEVCSISPSDFNEATAKRLLWGGPEECSQGNAPLLRYLERQCAICGQQLTNQQDWRRHMRKVHKQTWEEAERHLGGTASRVQFVRPCKFCRVHFTKTPQLHSQKCLPLLQLAYIQQHHGRSVGPEGGGKTVGHALTNGTHVGRRAGQRSASQVPQNQGAVWAASGKKGLGAEIGPNPGAPDDGEDHCPTRDSPAAPGGGSQLDPVHGGRRARHHTATDADDCDVEEIPHARHVGLRQALMGALLMELVARLQKLGADAPAQQRLSKAKLLSTEPWRGTT